MLSYLIKTTTSLLMAMILLGITAACTKLKAKTYERIIVITGAALGLIASILMSIAKNATSKIDTSAWNLRIFAASLTAFALLLIFSIKGIGKKLGKAADVIFWCMTTVIVAASLFYTLPDVWAFPYQMVSAGQSMISTDFLYKMIGFVSGWILMIVVLVASYQCVIRLSDRGALLLLKLSYLINALRQASVILSIVLAKRMIKSNHTLFTIAKYTSNYSNGFIYLSILLIFVVTVVLWVRSFHVNEPYENPAQHRKIKAKWRSIRRWAGTAVIAFVLCIANMTVINAYDNKVVELSPVEDARVSDGNVYVTFEQVADGHLHRFAYKTDHGVEIRFIVIKKPNSSSYGIGLDACDICGETGYYEKDGQVVCKLCDVVMNISTIGFKGGCNPIVVPYEIENGEIIVPIDGLMEYEREFR